jgi:hypothetical protein
MAACIAASAGMPVAVHCKQPACSSTTVPVGLASDGIGRAVDARSSRPRHPNASHRQVFFWSLNMTARHVQHFRDLLLAEHPAYDLVRLARGVVFRPLAPRVHLLGVGILCVIIFPSDMEYALLHCSALFEQRLSGRRRDVLFSFLTLSRLHVSPPRTLTRKG